MADTEELKVHWATTNMRTTYANVSNVTSTREEVTVELSDRIILNPYAAKRLLLVLKNVLDQYESRFGQLKIEA